MVNNINNMNQTKTLYIANYLELNNKGILPVCKEGCDQLLGVPYNCNAHGNLKNCINTLYDILTDDVVTPDGLVKPDGVVTSDLSASAQIWTPDLSTSLPDDQVIIIAEYNVDDSTQHKDITIPDIVKCNDWIIRVGDGKNFKNSSKYGIWGIKSRCAKFFLKKVNFGDRLWFVTSKSQGQLIGLSTYCSHNYREFGPLLNISMTDDELGWTDGDNTWDIEIHYTDLYDLEHRILLTHIRSPMVIREYNNKCKINLPAEYNMTKLD